MAEAADTTARGSRGAPGSPVRYELHNGLRVVLDPVPGQGGVVVCLALGLGARHDPNGAEGAAWLWQRLQAAPDSRSARAARIRRLGAAGGSQTDTTSADHTLILTQAPTAALELALQVSADPLSPLSVTEPAYRGLRREAADAQHGKRAPSLDAAGEHRLMQLMFQGFEPYARVGSESAQTVLDIPLATVIRLHEQHVGPSAAVLTVSGSFSSADARRWVEQYFSKLPRRAPARSMTPETLGRQTSERFNVNVNPKAKAPLAFYGWPLPVRREQDARAARVIAALLQDGALLESAPSAGSRDIDEVRAWVLPFRDAAALAVRLSVNRRSNVDKARAVLERELERLGSAGPSNEELERARARISASLEQELDAGLTRAALLSRYELEAGSAQRVFDEPEQYARVTRDQVRRLARERLVETRRTTVEIYPPGWRQDPPPAVVRRQHIVKPGENLIQIAQRYHSDVDVIAKANKIQRHRFIFPGQELVIPVKMADLERAKRRSYTVKPGDTLIGIAKRHRVSVADLMRENRRRPKQMLRAGEILTIPDRSKQRSGPRSKLRQHRVKRGDSLLGLARKYGVSATEIAKANGRRPNQPILAGEVLDIPAAKAPGRTLRKKQEQRR